MATSTYFGWAEPDDTDLVKNGASAMRTLGNAIDSSLYPIANAAGKNKCVNGGFDIWQRSTSNATTGYQTADRWYQICAGTTTVSQDTDVPTAGQARYSIKQLTSAGSSYAQYQYSLEQAEVIPLRGKTITVSWYMKANATWSNAFAGGNYFYSNSTDARASQSVAVTTGYTNPTGATPTTSWARYYETITIPSDAVGFQKQFNPAVAQASGAALWIANVQFELGTVPTPFSRAGGTIQGELAACQRYYFRTNFDAASSYPTFGQGGANSTTQARTLVNFPCNMRTKPTTIDYPTIGTYFTVIDFADAGVTPTSVSLDSNQTDSKTGYLLWNVSSGLTQNRPYFVRGNNSTAAYLGWSAEL